MHSHTAIASIRSRSTRRRGVARHLVAALAVATAIGAFAPKASACGGGWFPEVKIDHRIQGIARAERDLAAGRYQAAAGSVLRMIPHIRNFTAATNDPIVNRALRVLAVATVRGDGQLDLKREIPSQLHATWLGEDGNARTPNLQWSANTLAAVSETKADDPVMQGELGEALAKLDTKRDDGRKMLEKLADKDLLTSPQAYLALADLRGANGDKDGRAAALKRCRAMAKDASVCGSAASGQS